MGSVRSCVARGSQYFDRYTECSGLIVIDSALILSSKDDRFEQEETTPRTSVCKPLRLRLEYSPGANTLEQTIPLWLVRTRAQVESREDEIDSGESVFTSTYLPPRVFCLWVRNAASYGLDSQSAIAVCHDIRVDVPLMYVYNINQRTNFYPGSSLERYFSNSCNKPCISGGYFHQ